MILKLQAAFSLGFLAAEHVHGVNHDGNQDFANAVFKILEKVANGELTLLNTPEETIAGLPPPPPDLAATSPDAIKKALEQLVLQVGERTRQAMRDQREVASELLKAMT